MIKLRLPQLIDVFCQPRNEITTQRRNQLFFLSDIFRFSSSHWILSVSYFLVKLVIKSTIIIAITFDRCRNHLCAIIIFAYLNNHGWKMLPPPTPRPNLPLSIPSSYFVQSPLLFPLPPEEKRNISGISRDHYIHRYEKIKCA